MNEQSNDNSPDKSDDAVDRRIREALRATRNAALPSSIEHRVFSTIKQRRNVWRGTLAGLMAVLLAAVSFASYRYLQVPPQTALITNTNAGAFNSSGFDDLPEFDEAEFVSLSAAPPVISLGLVDSKQFALLEGLKSLKEAR